jgi:hypothetical protein
MMEEQIVWCINFPHFLQYSSLSVYWRFSPICIGELCIHICIQIDVDISQCVSIIYLSIDLSIYLYLSIHPSIHYVNKHIHSVCKCI